MTVVVTDAPTSTSMPSVQDFSSSNEEATPVIVRPDRATPIVVPLAHEAGPSIVVEVSGVMSGATDDNPHAVQEEELGVEETAEQHEIAAPDDMIGGGNDECLSPAQGEEPIFSEQPGAVAPSDMTKGSGDEGPRR
ncbi:hypothetical protein AMTR_s00052p00201080 [Amborella trichopoda]|uniref:Uncharacterized protein n=1 Tax=Amborella trichopoda TaxID=13333 RepID=U5CT69_AMBTC|nr:hypothetical protein AMTR_s00052p00201080 [Amborella trichopoda]